VELASWEACGKMAILVHEWRAQLLVLILLMQLAYGSAGEVWDLIVEPRARADHHVLEGARLSGEEESECET
jgi:hypothetical protein